MFFLFYFYLFKNKTYLSEIHKTVNVFPSLVCKSKTICQPSVP